MSAFQAGDPSSIPGNRIIFFCSKVFMLWYVQQKQKKHRCTLQKNHKQNHLTCTRPFTITVGALSLNMEAISAGYTEDSIVICPTF